MGLVESYSSLKRLLLTALLLTCTTLSVGCVQMGQPLVAEQSQTAAPPRPSDAGVLKPTQPPRTKAPVVGSSSTPATSAGGSNSSAASASAPQGYVVQRGETLYAIAWRFQLDHRSLAQANQIAAPYTIFPGQRLQIRGKARQPWRAPQQPRVAESTAGDRTGTSPAAGRSPAASPPSRPTPLSAAAWVWPVTAQPSREFSRSSKGIDFSIGQPTTVRSTNHGEVVYAGNGIGGYERLIIVKHSQNLLSAYSFNGVVRVREGQQVKAGAQVADIMNRGRTAQKLHFELRRNGEPINPRSKLR